MIQGTTSDAGKSTLVTGLCRILSQSGIAVAPFKPQNMALNSAVTVDGGEIGRAQAVQAHACGIAPHSDMNPVLLKPASDKTAQVVIQGKARAVQNAIAYHDYKATAYQAVQESFDRLSRQYQAIIVEGAGSPAEINLRENDIANMGFAEAVDCPVILVADIDRGGVFAHLVGTLELLSPSERQRVKGFVINRFRGDLSLLQNGLDWLENKTQKPVLGVIPYIHGLHLEAEDALPRQTAPANSRRHLKIIVPALPRISNHTDFDPLRLRPDVEFQFIGPDREIPAADLIILPGSKAVIEDLRWLKNQGWQTAILRHLRYGGKLLGICGGYQMLGQEIHDPLQLEGTVSFTPGLGLLNIRSTLQADKRLKQVSGNLTLDDAQVQGYEIHHGHTDGEDLARPLVITANGCDGAISMDKQVAGCYMHGLFDAEEACTALLKWAGLPQPQKFDYPALRESELNRLATTFEDCLDMPAIYSLMQLTRKVAS